MSLFAHNEHRNFYCFRATLISGAAVLTFFALAATAAFAETMMRRDSGGDMHKGVGIGTGVGIGIGIGETISRQPTGEPETHRTSKKKSKRVIKREITKPIHRNAGTPDAEQSPALKFVGKPDDVTHNPRQKVGKLGDLNDHKQVAVFKGGSYFIRHYYFVREGDQRSWYYYDVPDTTTAKHKDVPDCKVDDDNCDGPPQPPIYVDNNPADGGAGQIEEGTGKPCGEVRVRNAWTKCVDKTVHEFEDVYNYCPPKTKYQVYHSDIDTKLPCDGGNGGGGIAKKYDPFPLGADCKKVAPLVGPPMNGGSDWVYEVYEGYECAGKIYRSSQPVIETDGPVTGSPHLPDKLLPPLPAAQ